METAQDREATPTETRGNPFTPSQTKSWELSGSFDCAI
jgi:hypothetical protein